jgi:alpha-amylase/alpha-mannosidase (GH57 family)
VHGHFYQPPRENPWLEAIEAQDSAYPYHDWNERIAAECYGPNAFSRILDGEGRIVKISNNYARMSFNVGPTLLSWLEEFEPEIYREILAADRESVERFGGHGSAIAQCYNHMIMPLANRRDKETQVVWGIRDFKHRFGRVPEGMWLPETAVDIETLDIMAAHGIKFVILEPGQAKRVRRTGRGYWKDVSGGKIDSTRAYFTRLPSGRRIGVFFYDGPISRGVAFEGLLDDGEKFAHRLAQGFSDGRAWAQLVNIATDGESYGHHHDFGDMALAYALEHIESESIAKLTNYGQYIELHPPDVEAEIWENTSWSCAHGVERWQSDCGCSTGSNPERNQAWRRPLRDALDWLRDIVAPLYEEQARTLFRDPWQARNEYIDVILNRDDDSVTTYLEGVSGHPLSDEETIRALKFLELQRHAMLMYTSCGWFFDDISGIEPRQVVHYAGRAIQLAHELFGDHIEEHFLGKLSAAVSNLPEQGNGRDVYERYVRPSIVDLPKVAAHYAISSLFEDYGEEPRIYCYKIGVEDRVQQSEGAAQMAVGRARVRSVITGESDVFSFGVLHFGDHNFSAGVRSFVGDSAYATLNDEANDAFRRADLPEVIRLLDKHFGDLTYSLRSLFRDEQRKVLAGVLESTVSEMEAPYRQIFEHHAPLMRFLVDVGFPMPASFKAAAQLVINSNLREVLNDGLDPDDVSGLIDDSRNWNVELDEAGLAYTAELAAEAIARRFAESPQSIGSVRALETAIEAIKRLPFSVDVSAIQNIYWNVSQSAYPAQADRGWLDSFRKLGALLSMHVE